MESYSYEALVGICVFTVGICLFVAGPCMLAFIVITVFSS